VEHMTEVKESVEDVRLPESETEVPKKKHWTQLPENAAKLTKIRKASWKARTNKAKYSSEEIRQRSIHARRAFCGTCKRIILDKYAHRIAYPSHHILWNRKLTLKQVNDAVNAKRAGTVKKPRVVRVPGGKNAARRIFCVTCDRPFSNKYEHREKFPNHVLRPVNVDTPPKTNGHRIVSVVGSKVPLHKSNGTVPETHTLGDLFTAGFKAGYKFREGMELYASEQKISLETLVSSAAKALESE
jgi:hypothetical protein